MEKNTTKDKYNVVLIPDDVLEIIRTKLGEEILLVYDDDTNEVALVKKRESFTKALRGLGKEIWKIVGEADYIDRRERHGNSQSRNFIIVIYFKLKE